MIRKHKKYSKPKKRYEKERIEHENSLKKEFGLKNKREIWKSDAKIKKIREKAKKLITSNQEEQRAFFNRLKKIGLDVNSIGEILALDVKDLMNRRLQTILVKKGLSTTMKGSRQLIIHKKVLIDGKIINVPSYIVPVELEDKIKIRTMKIKKKKEKTLDIENSEEEAIANEE